MSFRFPQSAPVAVIGAGTMGIGIAQLAAAGGHDTLVIDAAPEALAHGRTSVEASARRAVARGQLEASDAAARLTRLSWSTDLDAARSAALVIEAIVEAPAPKIELFRTLEAVAPAAVLASNTSSLSIAALSEALRRPEHFLGLHFFNPATAMRLVEVVPGPRTDPALTTAASDLMRRWGKSPVTVRDVPGFIVNRVARPYYAEGFAALDEGLAAADIDHALTAAGGFRLGPLELADLIGHDVNYAVAASVHAAYGGVTRFRPQPAQARLVAAGQLGRKSGQGVYAGAPPPPALEPPVAAPDRIRISPIMLELEPLARALRVTGAPLLVDAGLPRDTFEVEGVRIAGQDGRRAAALADAWGRPVALIDGARDFGQAPTIVFAVSGSSRARAAAVGLAQAAGRQALVLPDRPGGVVLRTLAQLANAAADAVADGVAAPDDIDEAMIAGANHPEGPLAWARRFGPERLVRVLDRIAEATGDPLYAPGAWLRRGAP